MRSLARSSGLTQGPELRIEVRAERRGSWEVWVWIANAAGQGLVGAATVYAAISAGKGLLGWYRVVIRSHADVKRRTVNIDKVVVNLEAMAKQDDVDLIDELQVGENLASLRLTSCCLMTR